MEELEPIQQMQVDALNKLIASQSVEPTPEQLGRKMFNPQTGELQLFVDDGNGGVRMASVNIFE
jgi:hypothetical protein